MDRTGMELEEEYLTRAQNDDEYSNILMRLEQNLAKEFPSNRGMKSTSKSSEDNLDFALNHQTVQAEEKKSVSSGNVADLIVGRQTHPSLMNPLNSLDHYRSRVFHCQQKLQKKLIEVPRPSDDCLEKCRNLLLKISNPHTNLPIEVIDDIEYMLGNRLKPVDAKAVGNNYKNSGSGSERTTLETSSNDSLTPSVAAPLADLVGSDEGNRNLNQSSIENVTSQVFEWSLATNKINVNSPPMRVLSQDRLNEISPVTSENSQSQILNFTMTPVAPLQNPNTVNPNLKPSNHKTQNQIGEKSFHSFNPPSCQNLGFLNSQFNFRINSTSNSTRQLTMHKTHVNSDGIVKPTGNQQPRQVQPSIFNNTPSAIQPPNIAAAPFRFVGQHQNFAFNQHQRQNSSPSQRTGNIQQGFPFKDLNARPVLHNFPSSVPKTNQPENDAVTWRQHAQEALLKTIMQLENKVYSAAESKENYVDFFKDVFTYANTVYEQKSGIRDSSSSQLSTVKVADLEKIKNLLPNEPPSVVENVAKDWHELDSKLSNMLQDLSPSELDQPSASICFQPDEFETKIETVLRAVSPNEINSVP